MDTKIQKPLLEPIIEPLVEPTLEHGRCLPKGINCTASALIQLVVATKNYELEKIHFFMLPFFYGIPNEAPWTFIGDFYSTEQTFPL